MVSGNRGQSENRIRKGGERKVDLYLSLEFLTFGGMLLVAVVDFLCAFAAPFGDPKTGGLANVWNLTTSIVLWNSGLGLLLFIQGLKALPNYEKFYSFLVVGLVDAIILGAYIRYKKRVYWINLTDLKLRLLWICVSVIMVLVTVAIAFLI